MKPVPLTSHIQVGSKNPLLLIAGPCVIESQELCLEIASYCKRLAEEMGVHYVFKASFDKANRTSYTSYRGPGLEKGLAVLANVRDQLQVPVLTDVHETVHVPQVAEVVDILQIPAFLCRQTDLLIKAGETGKTVNIKKGQFCSAQQMMEAAKKVASTGNHRILLTERGNFFGYGNLVVDMRNLVWMRQSGYPVIFDATHSVQFPGGLGTASGGDREMVPPLARAAVAVGIDGLFLEVHPDPDQALSDGPNSISLATLSTLLQEVLAIHALCKCC